VTSIQDSKKPPPARGGEAKPVGKDSSRGYDGRTITFTSKLPDLRVQALLGATPPKITGGYGGWTQQERPHRRGLYWWQGPDALTLEISILLDGWATKESDPWHQDSVEDDMYALERMAGVDAKPNVQPPFVKIYGSVPTHCLTKRWVLNGIAWDDQVIRSNMGIWLRQGATLSFVQVIEQDQITRLAGMLNSDRTGTTGPTYRTQKGDTWKSIAASQLNDARRAKTLATLNGVRDFRKAIKPGTSIKLP
jgi:hypothetical protein